ncbi:PIG-L family deacetylase [Parafilimonas sp.]|uniref:PIG-L family deacetylase n=1 Tax=Parafilimonas sp. TaxID=1969739 RepID=UPI0039E48E5F
MMCKKVLFLLLIPALSFIPAFSMAQTPPAYNSADIYRQLKKLNVLGSVLYIAAHPDDENTRLLTYFANGELWRTGYLSLTRGDGGQNLIGDEQGIELGLIRTQELLSARRIDGAEQFFSRAYDFGFSKTSDEALKFWGHDKILSDVVWVIRNFQPDVIITRFPGDARAGHGHHAASSILAKEAFTAAADSAMFPEQFKYGVQPWQAKRILWNTFNFDGDNTTSNGQFKMETGAYNSLLGKSYGEIASLSRSQHRTQGFGSAAQRGQAYEYFELLAGTPVENGLFDGIDTSWQRIGAANMEQQVDAIITSFQFEHPENTVDALLNLYTSIKQLPDSYWKNKKLGEVKQLLIECSGIYAEATTSNEFGVQQQKFTVQFFVNKRLDANVALKNIKLLAFDSVFNTNLATNANLGFSHTFVAGDNMPVTQPYWLQYGIDSIGSFTVKDQTLIGKAQNDAACSASFTFHINGTDVTIDKPVQYRFTNPARGELYEPFIIINPLSVSLQPSVILTSIKQNNTAVKNDAVYAQVKSYIDAPKAKLRLFFVQNKDSVFIKDTVVDLEYNQTYDFSFPLSKYYSPKQGDPSVAVEVSMNNKPEAYSGDLHAVQYEHIPDVHYYATDKIHVVNEEVKTVGRRIGYIPGAGDKLPQGLRQMGYNVTLLSAKDVTPSNLKQFDAVITGVRAYNIYEWLNEKYSVLMNYVKDGGNLIVQYNTNNQNGAGRANIGPYNFIIGRTRVTEEVSPVHILLPNSPALNYPNKITSADFNNWIQERSTYHAEQLDEHYQAPLGMHDVNEPESNGSLIIARYGKGNFVYAGIVFFRQLPAGVGGAYRLMANLIALPKEK